MRLITTTLASVGFLLAGVNAVIQDLAVPKTIRPGDKFNITGHQTSGQGYGEILIMFGVQDSSNPSSSYYPGEMGSLFAGPFDLASFGYGYNLTIPNVSLPSAAPGPAVIHATILGRSGVHNRVGLVTLSIDTTIGTSTSDEYVYSSGRGPSCGWTA